MKQPFLLLLSILLCLSHQMQAQTQTKSTAPCNCATAFDDLIVKLENNYIGLAQIKASQKGKTYEERKNSYLQKVAEVDAQNCTAFINDFLDFFEDGHLLAFERPNYTEDEVAAFKKSIKDSRMDKGSLLKAVQNLQANEPKGADRILGKWTDGISEFAVIKEEDQYKALILSSTMEEVASGELKALFTPSSNGYSATYYSYNYSPRFVAFGIYKEGTLLVGGNIFWKRVDSPFQRELEAIDQNNFEHPTLRVLDKQYTLLSIPSFLVDYNTFKQFLDQHKETLKNTETLIIDLRANRGGNAIYFPLIAMYATQDMEGSQGLVLASEDNFTYFKRQEKYSSKIYKPLTERITANMGAIVDGPLYPGRKFKKAQTKIQHVAILTDEACISAAESFILHSKRSSTKVKTFGSPTGGVIDYTSVNGLLLDSGKQYIYFGYPTSTLHKEIPENGYNKTGIIPDVPIDTKVKDKVDFIVRYFQE